jgi:Glutathione-dependent formaldehyde-activating enzyme
VSTFDRAVVNVVISHFHVTPLQNSALLLASSDPLISIGEINLEVISKNFMKIPFTGGCACGAIRYESTAEPMMMLHFHCRDCQRSSGGPFSSFVVVPAEAFNLLQGSPRFHASPSARGGASALSAARRLWSRQTRTLTLSGSGLRAWMIRAGSICKWTCGHQTRIRGTK